jgi:hypothetical protein
MLTSCDSRSVKILGILMINEREVWLDNDFIRALTLPPWEIALPSKLLA